ncbi:MAG: LysE family translocator [Granulosicoccaceae bacterium]
MVDVISLSVSALAFYAVAVTPGPANLSNATIAMSHGRKTSLAYSLGLSFGLVFWGLIAASGMGVVLQGSVFLLMALKIVGGLYLLWLAFLSARSASEPGPENLPAPTEKRWFLRGLVLNVSNPKSVIAWMTALSVGLDANDGLQAVVATTLVCAAVGFINNALYSYVFSIDGMCAHIDVFVVKLMVQLPYCFQWRALA